MRQFVRESGLTYGEIADALDISKNYLFRLCSGDRRMNERTARAIAYTLDINVSELREDDHVPA